MALCQHIQFLQFICYFKHELLLGISVQPFYTAKDTYIIMIVHILFLLAVNFGSKGNSCLSQQGLPSNPCISRVPVQAAALLIRGQQGLSDYINRNNNCLGRFRSWHGHEELRSICIVYVTARLKHSTYITFVTHDSDSQFW